MTTEPQLVLLLAGGVRLREGAEAQTATCWDWGRWAGWQHWGQPGQGLLQWDPADPQVRTVAAPAPRVGGTRRHWDVYMGTYVCAFTYIQTLVHAHARLHVCAYVLTYGAAA